MQQDPHRTPVTGAARQRDRSCRRYSVEKQLALIRAYENSEQDMRLFCAEHELSSASLCKWRRRYETSGEAQLASSRRPGNGLVPNEKDGVSRHDVTVLGPNSEVEVISRFREFPGIFVFHCHDLEHEDLFMMVRFDVR